MANSADVELQQYLKNSADVSVAEPKIRLPPGHGTVWIQQVVVKMKPFGKARPRVVRSGGKSHTYMPPAYTAKRDKLRTLFGQVKIEGKLAIEVIAVRPMPKSWSAKKRERMRGKYHTHKPDADNIVGAVMDALLEEDSNVVCVECTKVWGDEGELDITIKRMEDDE